MVLLSSLFLGLAAVTWRAKGRVADAQARARNEALAVSAALQAQLTQPVLVVEVLEALAKQSGGVIPNFQKVAGDLLGARPTENPKPVVVSSPSAASE